MFTALRAPPIEKLKKQTEQNKIKDNKIKDVTEKNLT